MDKKQFCFELKNTKESSDDNCKSNNLDVGIILQNMGTSQGKKHTIRL